MSVATFSLRNNFAGPSGVRLILTEVLKLERTTKSEGLQDVAVTTYDCGDESRVEVDNSDVVAIYLSKYFQFLGMYFVLRMKYEKELMSPN